MKTRLVVWGENEANEKLLITAELKAAENKVEICSIPESIATQELHQALMGDWRSGKDVELPSGYQQIIRPLSLTEGLLPDHLKVLRTDVLTRAQTEWHFVVLSHKLSGAYQSEINDLKERVANLEGWEDSIWEELKGFWKKVQDQVREKNLFWDHFRDLREQTDNLFTDLKTRRKAMDEIFDQKSKENLSKFSDMLEELEGKIEKGLGLQPIFQQLKELQFKIKDHDFNRGDRNKIWKRIDKNFKAVKAKMFGEDGKSRTTSVDRLTKRYEGLVAAIDRMERSIHRDEKDLTYETKRMEQSEGQLENQIRAAKLGMIQERIRSKREKLDDMTKTKGHLATKIAKEQQREEQRKENEVIKQKQEQLKEQVQRDIKSARAELEGDQKIISAAAQIKEAQPSAKKVAQTKVSTPEKKTAKKKKAPTKAEATDQSPSKKATASNGVKPDLLKTAAAVSLILSNIKK